MMHIKNFDEFISENLGSDELEIFKLDEGVNEIIEKIKRAIEGKFNCTIYYKGEVSGVVEDGYRNVRFYALGTNETGNMVARAWMTSGKSRKGRKDPSLVPGWRLYRVDRINICNLTLVKFTQPDEGWKEKDSQMTEILISAKFL